MVNKKQTRLIKRYQLEHLVPLFLTLISFWFWFNYFELTFFGILGLIINLIGLIIWWSAKITLGENWDAGYGKPNIKKLVTAGVYSKISHPLYLGINLTLIGLALIYTKLWFILIVLTIVIYFFTRMHVENKFLTKKLGKRYLDYKNKTWI